MKNFEDWWNSNEYFKTRIDRHDAERGWNACAKEYRDSLGKVRKELEITKAAEIDASVKLDDMKVRIKEALLSLEKSGVTESWAVAESMNILRDLIQGEIKE